MSVTKSKRRDRDDRPLNEAECELVYDQAVAYLGKGAYRYAGKLLRRIEASAAGYRDVAQLIRIADEGKRAQQFVQWGATLFAVFVVLVSWFVWRQNDFWTLVIGLAALLVGIGLSQQLYARFLSPQPRVSPGTDEL